MTPARIEIDLAAVEHNARVLVGRLRKRGIAVTGVTKATLGSPEVARAMLRGGVKRLGDSRVENLAALRQAGITTPLTLLRAPSPDAADAVVASANITLVSDADSIAALSAAAGRRAMTHGIVLMVELGDLREGLMTADVLDAARLVARTRHVQLTGIGTTLGSRSGVIPSDEQMRQLSGLASTLAAKFGVVTPVISGGNSASLRWALGSAPVGHVNDLRLGEAILLGTDPLTRTALPGLRRDAFRVVGSVIESLEKPSAPWGRRQQAAFGEVEPPRERGTIIQTIVALGRQDIDAEGLRPPTGVRVLAATSDHLVLETPSRLPAGTEIPFGVNNEALMRAMTSPFVTERFITVPVAGPAAAEATA